VPFRFYTQQYVLSRPGSGNGAMQVTPPGAVIPYRR
jgi:hypothetical protein